MLDLPKAILPLRYSPKSNVIWFFISILFQEWVRKWQHKLFPTPVPLTRRPAGNQTEISHQCENSRTWAEAVTPTWVTEAKNDCIRRARGTISLCSVPSPGHHSATLRRSPWAYGFSGGKREPKLPQCCETLPRKPPWVLPLGDHWGRGNL